MRLAAFRSNMSLMSHDYGSLPKNLVAPEEDGAADHLVNKGIPPIALASTSGRAVVLSTRPGRTVVYIYPMTGVPGKELPQGWDEIPGARGCTPQSCSFRDHYENIKRAGVSSLFGLSTQNTAYQMEAAERLHLPFALLSDQRLELGASLRLPIFEVEGNSLYKRLTLVIDEGRITHVFYPVFPPNESAAVTLGWLCANPAPIR
jgi:peroxiredoxin